MGVIADIMLGYLCEDAAQISSCIGVDGHRSGRAVDMRVDEAALLDSISVAIASGAVELAIRRKKDSWVLHFGVE